jgi:hypothetical protein
MSKRKRIFFSYFILLIFTWQLGLLCSTPLFDSNDSIEQLSSLTEDAEDDDSDTEESESELFTTIHDSSLIVSSLATEFKLLTSTKFNATNELASNQADFKTPYSPPEKM